MFRRMYLCLSPQFTYHIKYYKISKYEYLLKVGGSTGRTDGKNGKNAIVSFPHGYFVRPINTKKSSFQNMRDRMLRIICPS